MDDRLLRILAAAVRRLGGEIEVYEAELIRDHYFEVRSDPRGVLKIRVEDSPTGHTELFTVHD